MSKNVQIGVFDLNSGCLHFQTHRTKKHGIRAGVWLAMPPLTQASDYCPNSLSFFFIETTEIVLGSEIEQLSLLSHQAVLEVLQLPQ